MSEGERSTPTTRRERRISRKEVEAAAALGEEELRKVSLRLAEEEGSLSFEFLKGRRAGRKRGRKRGG